MNVLDRVREKYGTPRGGTDKTNKSPFGTSVSPQGRDSEGFFDCNAPNEGVGVLVDLNREKARRDAQKRDEARRKRLEPVLKLMADDGDNKDFFCVLDHNADPDHVILVFAIRGKGSGELSIPKEKYDPFLLMEILDKHNRSGPDS